MTEQLIQVYNIILNFIRVNLYIQLYQISVILNMMRQPIQVYTINLNMIEQSIQVYKINLNMIEQHI